MGLRDTMEGLRGGIPASFLLNDPNFYDTTAYVHVIVFDIQGHADRMGLVSRGTVAGFGQFSLEENDARHHKTSRQGNQLTSLRPQYIEAGRPAAGHSDG